MPQEIPKDGGKAFIEGIELDNNPYPEPSPPKTGEL